MGGVWDPNSHLLHTPCDTPAEALSDLLSNYPYQAGDKVFSQCRIQRNKEGTKTGVYAL